MEDARTRAFSRSLGSKIRTASLPLLIAAAFYAAPKAHATPECQNLGAGDPMTANGAPVTDGNDTCQITSASPLANNVDALSQSAATGSAGDILKLDVTSAAFSFDLSKIGTEFTNFETVQIEGPLTGTNVITLTGTNSASASWVNHGFVRGNANFVGNFTNDGGTIAPGLLAGNMDTVNITGNYTTTTNPGHFNMDVNLTSGAADFIHATGTITGGTYINVTQANAVDAGVATTGNGILLVRSDGVMGSSAFALENAVVSGAYQYVLQQVTVSGTDHSLFLQSQLREEFYGHDALLAGGQTMVRSCFRSDQRIPDAPRSRDNVRFWGGAGVASFETGVDAGVKFDDQMYCADGGLDFGLGEGIRFGVTGGYGSSRINVFTPGGVGKLDGKTGALEALLAIGTPQYFFNVTAGYATTDWTFDGAVGTPKDATQSGLIGSAQAGATINVTPFRFKFIGAVNYDHTSCGSDCLFTGMTEDSGIVEAKGTIRIEAMTHQINPYVAVSFSDDLSGGNTVSFAGESLNIDAGHSLLSLNAGFNAPIDDGVLIYGDASMIDGIGNETSGYTIAGGFKAFW